MSSSKSVSHARPCCTAFEDALSSAVGSPHAVTYQRSSSCMPGFRSRAG